MVVVLLILVIGGTLLGLLGVRAYLHSENFRRLVSRQTGKVLRGEAEFGPFRWQGLQARTDSFQTTGEGPVTHLRADGVAAEIGLGGWWRGVWEVRGAHVRKLSAKVDLTGETPPRGAVVAQNKDTAQKNPGGWIPNRVNLADAEISNIDVDLLTKQGPIALTGTRLQAVSKGAASSYLARLDGGQVRLPFDFCSSLEIEQAELRWQQDTLYLTSLDARLWGKGKCHAMGEWDRNSGGVSADGSVSDVPVSELLRGDWVKRVGGRVDSTFAVSLKEREKSAWGDIRISEGTLTALPVLDVLAAYADTSRFRFLPLHEAHAKWRWRDGEWRISDLVLFSEGLARLEGGMTLRGQNIDGLFRLGLPPGTLTRIPGAETDVFLPGEHGLLWTTLRVTGTLDDPKEDLSERLITAAGLRMFEKLPETGEQVLRHSHTLAREVAPRIMEKGIHALDKGQRILDGAGSLLDGILGAPPPREKDSGE